MAKKKGKGKKKEAVTGGELMVDGYRRLGKGILGAVKGFKKGFKKGSV